MIAQKNRLKKADFELIFKNGNKRSNSFFNLRYLSNEFDYCRFAIIVSNKISKKATERNRIKRQLKAIIKENLVKFKGNIDLIITVLPPVKESKLVDIKENFLNLAKKSNIL